MISHNKTTVSVFHLPIFVLNTHQNNMKSILITILTALSFSLVAQQPWSSVDESRILNRNTAERGTIPNEYATYSLNLKNLRRTLASAPMESLKNSTQLGVIMDLPMPDGTLEQFRFVESPCMSPVLAAKFPSIKSYAGASTETESLARIDFSNHGFRAIISTPKGDVFIDPYFLEADENHISYYTADFVPDLTGIEKTCGVEDFLQQQETQQSLLKGDNVRIRPSHTRNRFVPVVQTTYRFALACTGRWGTQQGGTVDLVMAKMVTATNRLNSVFISEMSTKFELIDDNDKLIFFLATEPYSDPQMGGVVLGENTRVINTALGGSNGYDIGHVFTTTCTDGIAGVAFAASVCTGRKASGVSCLGNRNIDAFVVSTMAHEVAHQFAGGHTWAGCSDGTAGQFSGASSCEPGSGYSILSYSGICNSTNNTGPGIDLFHSCSLEQMKEFISFAGCGTSEETDNMLPDVWIEQQSGFSIPIGTPFELTGNAEDADGDNLTYTWDQIDIAGSLRNLGDQDGPLFRFREPTTSSTRIFPELNWVLRGQDWREERLPQISRPLTFRFVTRDNNPLVGGVNWADLAFNSAEEAGPFVVTEPSTTLDRQVGKVLNVQWDVANTDGPEVDCQFVDIYFSENEGESFDYLLLSQTPNDGSADVVIPNVRTLEGIIKVKGHNNVFFNFGTGRVRATVPTEPRFFADSPDKAIDICLPDAFTTQITSESILDFDGMVNLEVISELPDGALVEFGSSSIPADGSTSLTIDMNNVELDAVGLYEVVVRAIAPDVDTSYVFLNVFAGNGFIDDFQLESPVSGSAGVASLPNFVWNGSESATGYRLEVATSPRFSDDDIVVSREAGLDTTATGQFNLENSTLYYWRVIAYNDCFGEVLSETFTFGSNSLSCQTFISEETPVTIPSSGTPTVDVILDIEQDGSVTDLNVGLLRGTHTKLRTVRAQVISPQGTEVTLFEGQCNNTPTINAGFDDESAFPNGCPNEAGEKIQPLEPLATFIGESLAGNWTLRIQDIEAANGGTINEFQLELCSDRALNNPFLVNNEVMEVLTGSSNFVTRDELLSDDDDNTAEDLLYTLVTVPSRGILSIDGTPLQIGDQFSQAQLSNNEVLYSHLGTEDEVDNFVFTLIDGDGGWIEKTIVVINMSTDGYSDTDEPVSSDATFDIYPNPTNNIVHISNQQNDNTQWNYNLYDTNGRLIMRADFQNKTQISLRGMAQGVYYLNLTDGTNTFYKKILKTE